MSWGNYCGNGLRGIPGKDVRHERAGGEDKKQAYNVVITEFMSHVDVLKKVLQIIANILVVDSF